MFKKCTSPAWKLIELRSACALSLCALTLAACAPALIPFSLQAQAQPAAPRMLGTVKLIEGDVLMIATAAGAQVRVTVSGTTPVLQLPPGSTDLKAAAATTVANIAVGDRVLVTGKTGDTPSLLTAVRVVLMKSNDIAARQSAQQAEWQRNGTGGLVRAVDGSTLTLAAGIRTLKVQTTPTTIFRRYADDSVKFEDAKLGKLDQVRTGDQISVRGTKSEDGTSIAAEEVVTGTFENLSGSVTAVDATAGTITLQDLISKKTVTVHVTAKSDLRNLPAQTAAMFASRNVTPAATASAQATTGAAARPRNAGMDLSRMLAGLPAVSLADLKPGAAVMIVASQDRVGSDELTAITLLSGVEQILSATSSGGQPITLSPWNLGIPEAGGGGA
jgi:co-chaperonin GroES (HSP10)